MASDRFGFDPFPSPTRYPGNDFCPGPFSKWSPTEQQWVDAHWTPNTSQPNRGAAIPTP